MKSEHHSDSQLPQQQLIEIISRILLRDLFSDVAIYLSRLLFRDWDKDPAYEEAAFNIGLMKTFSTESPRAVSTYCDRLCQNFLEFSTGLLKVKRLHYWYTSFAPIFDHRRTRGHTQSGLSRIHAICSPDRKEPSMDRHNYKACDSSCGGEHDSIELLG